MPELAGQETNERTAADAAANTAPQAVEAAAGIDAPSIAPDHEAPPKADAPTVEPIRIEAPKIEANSDVKSEVKAETRAEPKPGKLIVMAPSQRSWDREEFAPHVKADEVRDTGSKRRLSAMAAVVAIAACVGAVSGALATAGMMHFSGPAPAQVADTSALDASVSRIDADIVALKANVEHTTKNGLSQINRTNDRLDKLEKAQAEPMAKLAKLSEAVDKLRATPPAPAPAQAAAVAPAKETTGTIAAPVPTQVATAAAGPAPVPAAPKSAEVKTEVGRLPTVEGWRLRDVANGGALIEGRGGLYEVYAGDPIPGLGRVDAIRRQDGRWVVVTAKGLIVAR
ncbi:hypothetical protein JQ621_19565 [Bradyrhizobium manausense]|uniref:hypothetical protein n=1 Tax=Bradyrhizobium manausense TaxID=989370 RepID=UPI001BADCE49|nr:hypothetical protein [Bradyrhizobium manausense]MBR1089666.1 hypothetical protein [Bradyrhizobium manausense]